MAPAPRHRQPGLDRPFSPSQPARNCSLRWYVARALGEENATSAHPPHRLRGARSHAVAVLAFGALASGSPPAAAASARTSTSRRATSRSRSLRRSSRSNSDSPRPATSSSRWRTSATRPCPTSRSRSTPATRRPAVRSRPAPISPGSPTRTGRVDPRERMAEVLEPGDLAEGPPHSPPAGADAAQTDTFSFGALSRATDRHDLAADSGRGRHLHHPLRIRRGTQRQGQGGDQRRRAGERRLRRDDQRQTAEGVGEQ